MALIHRIDGLIAEMGVAEEIVRWRIRLATLTRNMEHDELFMWLEKLRLRHADRSIVRDSVVLAPRVAAQLGDQDLSAWSTYKLLSRLTTESLVYLIAVTDNRSAHERVYEYLSELRHRRSQLSGADIIALGLRQGPQIGMVLQSLLRERVEGRVTSKEEEMRMARDLVAACRAADGRQASL
ncbi:MAG: hypothetical protein BWY79_00393 [Actinobacteria bacterium ADurb.Bin444]|nr:MAG: hypothetical protein BWY79_00393 [Actinobacteria bacterium ADurb.Bin444]